MVDTAGQFCIPVLCSVQTSSRGLAWSLGGDGANSAQPRTTNSEDLPSSFPFLQFLLIFFPLSGLRAGLTYASSGKILAAEPPTRKKFWQATRSLTSRRVTTSSPGRFSLAPRPRKSALATRFAALHSTQTGPARAAASLANVHSPFPHLDLP